MTSKAIIQAIGNIACEDEHSWDGWEVTSYGHKLVIDGLFELDHYEATDALRCAFLTGFQSVARIFRVKEVRYHYGITLYLEFEGHSDFWLVLWPDDDREASP